MKLETVPGLASIASSLRVTGENLSFDTNLSGPPSFLNLFSLLLKELFLYYLK